MPAVTEAFLFSFAASARIVMPASGKPKRSSISASGTEVSTAWGLRR